MKIQKIEHRADYHMTLDSLIKLYEGLIKSGKMDPKGAGAERLAQLQIRKHKRRKWLNTPYAKRKFMQAPQQI